ncbi:MULTISPECIES: hypothetical protein [Devosia]|uniref:Uncharacterized protein n=1 Tax=Devosia equisanguinis TaxID=2490941 RepID=A0A3S4CBC5_9HYPH|nr:MULTISPECIES: hypothetical protein [Devosia]ODT48905.1 MAG: hypothetical protein ABS74_10425 [Pelagibacterium sp. SCN 63-126]ODU89298.1 MAG: hypothetical protein ABT14_00155 [Pelagibacterium sp. SCN 63-17]OJX44165.1 MAG: hypothetical protein BGO80_00785 [Devosia sp. 63-57]VDS04357.1 hypothetical protein DEVEQU_01492 [Devosia equisanguinis]
MAFVIFLGAAVFEIIGCYLIWLAVRQGQLWMWVPALAALGFFGLLLALSGMDSAGRAFALYGGIYILASVLFMMGVEGIRPDRWDMIGAGLAIAGAAVIFLAPRGA